jgi:succinate-acetate transporter protein
LVVARAVLPSASTLQRDYSRLRLARVVRRCALPRAGFTVIRKFQRLSNVVRTLPKPRGVEGHNLVSRRKEGEVAMTVSDAETFASATARAPAPTGFAAGDPQILGLPIFAVGSLALGFSLVGYVPASAAGSIVPVIFAATGLGLVISAVWALGLGQTMVACVFGLFAGFWFSFAVLLLGLFHNWFLIPASAQVHSVALFLISWSIVFGALTLATLRLPAAYPAIIALVVVALALRTVAVLQASTGLDHVTGAVVFAFAALGIYVFLGIADSALGGSGYPLGPVLRR